MCTFSSNHHAIFFLRNCPFLANGTSRLQIFGDPSCFTCHFSIRRHVNVNGRCRQHIRRRRTPYRNNHFSLPRKLRISNNLQPIFRSLINEIITSVNNPRSIRLIHQMIRPRAITRLLIRRLFFIGNYSRRYRIQRSLIQKRLSPSEFRGRFLRFSRRMGRCSMSRINVRCRRRKRPGGSFRPNNGYIIRGELRSLSL